MCDIEKMAQESDSSVQPSEFPAPILSDARAAKDFSKGNSQSDLAKENGTIQAEELEVQHSSIPAAEDNRIEEESVDEEVVPADLEDGEISDEEAPVASQEHKGEPGISAVSKSSRDLKEVSRTSSKETPPSGSKGKKIKSLLDIVFEEEGPLGLKPAATGPGGAFPKGWNMSRSGGSSIVDVQHGTVGDGEKKSQKRDGDGSDSQEEKEPEIKRKRKRTSSSEQEKNDEEDDMIFVRGASPTPNLNGGDFDGATDDEDNDENSGPEGFNLFDENGDLISHDDGGGGGYRGGYRGGMMRGRGDFIGRGRGMRRGMMMGRGRGFGGLPMMERGRGRGMDRGGPRGAGRGGPFARFHEQEKDEQICIYYMQGKCHKGGDCPFSHNAIPMRKVELCKFYLLDCCAKKEKCLYMHNDFPCKFFHTGMKCFAGNRCKFSHNPLNDLTRKILLKHIDTAPKEILGEFPRLSREGATNLVVMTEAKRKNLSPNQMDVLDVDFDNMSPGMVKASELTCSGSILTVKQEGNVMHSDGEDRHSDKERLDKLPSDSRDKERSRKRRHRSRSGSKESSSGSSKRKRAARGERDDDEEGEERKHRHSHRRHRKHHKSDRSRRHSRSRSSSRSPKSSRRRRSAMKEEDSREVGSDDNWESVTASELPKPSFNFYQEIGQDATEDAQKSGEAAIAAGMTSSLPEMPKKQQELYMRIRQQQKEFAQLDDEKNENADQAGEGESESGAALDEENWYSSDDDMDKQASSKSTIQTEVKASTSPPTTDIKLNTEEISKINITPDIAKMLSILRSQASATSAGFSASSPVAPASSTPGTPSCDPMQEIKVETSFDNVKAEVYDSSYHQSSEMQHYPVADTFSPKLSPSFSRDPRLGSKDPRAKAQRHQQPEDQGDPPKPSIISQSSHLPVRDPRQRDPRFLIKKEIKSEPVGADDMDSLLKLPFKPIPSHTPATEINASLNSHPPMQYKLIRIDGVSQDGSPVHRTKAHTRRLSSEQTDPRVKKGHRERNADDSSDVPSLQSPKLQPPLHDPRTARSMRQSALCSPPQQSLLSPHSMRGSASHQNPLCNQTEIKPEPFESPIKVEGVEGPSLPDNGLTGFGEFPNATCGVPVGIGQNSMLMPPAFPARGSPSLLSSPNLPRPDLLRMPPPGYMPPIYFQGQTSGRDDSFDLSMNIGSYAAPYENARPVRPLVEPHESRSRSGSSWDHREGFRRTHKSNRSADDSSAKGRDRRSHRSESKGDDSGHASAG